MRTYKKVVREREEVDKFFCDWCGVEVPMPEIYHTFDWNMDCTIGKSYPDDCYGDGWKVEDLCQSCTEKLKHLLIGNGIHIKEYEY